VNGALSEVQKASWVMIGVHQIQEVRRLDSNPTNYNLFARSSFKSGSDPMGSSYDARYIMVDFDA
jgi:hypothetical protein